MLPFFHLSLPVTWRLHSSIWVCCPARMVPLCLKGPRTLAFCCCLWRRLYQGSAQLLQLPHVCSPELPASVIWGTQMSCSALLCSVGDTCRSGGTLPCKRCRVKELGDLPAAAAHGRVMLSSGCSYSFRFYSKHKWLSWKTKFTSRASDTIWAFIFFLMFN